jgi:hypothetical protein
MESSLSNNHHHHSHDEEHSDEWILQFFEEREKVKNDPIYRAELKTVNKHIVLGSSEPPISEYNDVQEENTAIPTQEQIYSYPDGAVYMGHMRQITKQEEEEEKDTLSHKRHGSGTLRTPAFVYGIPQKSYTSDEAVENARFAKWFEYIGTWKNDKLHGYGVHLQKSGDGGEIRIFEGLWENGRPARSIHAKDEDGDYNFIDDTVFGW